jgi:magnesium-transporting ATPase (P-type)
MAAERVEAPTEKESHLPINEKETATGKPEAPIDDDEDEDMDALIEELESQDGAVEEEETVEPGGARLVPEELLGTDTRHGLSSAEVLNRRKKYGMNQMKEEKENLILKFLGFFVGPIQFVMEVSFLEGTVSLKLTVARLPLFSLPVSRIGLISVSFALCCSSTPLSVSSRNTRLAPSSRS